jgi:hypothetical protein
MGRAVNVWNVEWNVERSFRPVALACGPRTSMKTPSVLPVQRFKGTGWFRKTRPVPGVS